MKILEQKIGHCGWGLALAIDDDEYFFIVDGFGCILREQEVSGFWSIVDCNFPKQAKQNAREVEIKTFEYDPEFVTKARELISV